MYAFIQTVQVSTTPQDSLECGFDYIDYAPPADLIWEEGLSADELDLFNQVFGETALTPEQLLEFDQAFEIEPLELVDAPAPDCSMPRLPNMEYQISVDDLLDELFGVTEAAVEEIIVHSAIELSKTIITPSPAIEVIGREVNDIGAEAYEPGNGWSMWVWDDIVINCINKPGEWAFNVSFMAKEVAAKGVTSSMTQVAG